MFELNHRYTFVAPQGAISDVGIWELIMFIRGQRMNEGEWKNLNPNYATWYLPDPPEDWLWVWLVQKGEYAGTMPKRLARYYFKQHQVKCPPAFLQQVGNIARNHSETNVNYTFDFTDTFAWKAGDFGDAGSCYFGSRSEARQIIADNGGRAIRFFNEDGTGYARAWLAPYLPSWIVFNGYGFKNSNATLTIARVMAGFFGLTYKKIDLSNHGETNETLWLNTGSGYIVGTSEDIAPVENVDLEWGEPENDHDECHGCGREIDEDHTYIGTDDHSYCERCYYENFESCSNCGETHYSDDITYVQDEYLCEYCFNRLATSCSNCGEYILQNDAHEHDGQTLCENCYEDVTAEE